MPGKLCNGVPTHQPYVSNAWAYCEGMAYRASGTAAAKPITGNPHSATGDPVDWQNWNRGWTAADGESGGTIPALVAGCCALAGVAVAA
jgi:hypothetical protein